MTTAPVTATPAQTIDNVRRLVYIVIIVAVALVACRRTPSYVVDPDTMADVLADMHVAESVVDMNQSEYSDDSMRKLLKQSVLERHHITQADFDTSLMWYGHHLDVYLDVYDDVIKILEKRNSRLGAAIIQSNASMSGDSVNVWPGSPYMVINSLRPSRFITFDLQADANSEAGDVYIWRLKRLDRDNMTVYWNMLALYDDESVDWLSLSTGNDGWNEVTFASDSTRTLRSLRGYVQVTRSQYYGETPEAGSAPDIYIDSISLVRKRLNDEMYHHHFRVKHYDKLGSPHVEPEKPVLHEMPNRSDATLSRQ